MALSCEVSWVLGLVCQQYTPLHRSDSKAQHVRKCSLQRSMTDKHILQTDERFFHIKFSVMQLSMYCKLGGMYDKHPQQKP